MVLSHGNGGSWINQTWLASALAHQGYIVAAVNHPGTTSRDRSPQAAALLWQRPVDLSRAIDAVTAQPEKFGAVAKDRIAIVGHSLGGWTVLEAGGARFDPERFAEDCKVHPQLSSCTAYQQMNTASTAQSKARLAADWRDKRVTAVVSLDLGLSRGMTDASLAAYPVPILVIAAGVPSKELPAELESVDLAKRLPKPHRVSSRSATPVTSVSWQSANLAPCPCSTKMCRATALSAPMARVAAHAQRSSNR